jgi:hypothetical protein
LLLVLLTLFKILERGNMVSSINNNAFSANNEFCVPPKNDLEKKIESIDKKDIYRLAERIAFHVLHQIVFVQNKIQENDYIYHRFRFNKKKVGLFSATPVNNFFHSF